MLFKKFNKDKKQQSGILINDHNSVKTKIARPDMDKITNSFQIIYNEFTKSNIYKDDSAVYDDMQEMISVLGKIYTRLYNRKKSNLNKEDIQVFVNHLMSKIKNLKNLIDKQ